MNAASAVFYTTYLVQLSVSIPLYLFLYYREIVEVSIAPKPQKLSAAAHAQLTDLLLAKDAELKNTLELADEQAKIQQKTNELKAEVDNKVCFIKTNYIFTNF